MKTVTINKIKVRIFEEDDLIQKLKMVEGDVNLVLEYQRKFPELLQEETNDFVISTKLLHKQLSVGRDYSTWIKSRINKYSFKENIDYEVRDKNTIHKGNGGDRKSKDYFATLEMALILARTERNNPKSIEVIKSIQNKLGKQIEIKEIKRPECNFGDMLDKITGIEWTRQFPIDGGKYRLDFYLENTLIIEYDEFYHESQKEIDLERIKYCRDWLAYNSESYSDLWRCPVIRVKQGEELEALNRIITHLVGFEILDGYNYGEEMNKICDIGTEVL